MKKAKLTMVVLALGLLGVSMACKKDDKKDDGSTSAYPKALTYNGYEVKEFKMYVGSPDGGKEVNTTAIDPKTYWGESINYYVEREKKNKITFLSETKLNYFNGTQGKDFFYTFDVDTLMVRENEADEWGETYTYGNKNRLYTMQSFYTYRSETRSSSSNIEVFYKLNDLLQRAGFSSLDDMKKTSDTVMFCNMYFVSK